MLLDFGAHDGFSSVDECFGCSGYSRFGAGLQTSVELVRARVRRPTGLTQLRRTSRRHAALLVLLAGTAGAGVVAADLGAFASKSRYRRKVMMMMMAMIVATVRMVMMVIVAVVVATVRVIVAMIGLGLATGERKMVAGGFGVLAHDGLVSLGREDFGGVVTLAARNIVSLPWAHQRPVTCLAGAANSGHNAERNMAIPSARPVPDDLCGRPLT